MFGLFGSKPAIKTYMPTELSEHLRAKKGACLLVDVREDQEWAGGHIRGAVHAPLSRFAEAAEKLPKDLPLIFYCQGGVRSKRAFDAAKAKCLQADGHLGGGLSAWRAAGLPVER
jgi:rhodanese-related sulfurtransferase